MTPLWRISNYGGLEGLGGEKTDGRWHTAARGKRIVYLSEHPALALIEVLMNLKVNPKLFPATYQLMKVRVAEGVNTESLVAGILPNEWRENTEETQLAGDEWLAARRSALLAVPSAPSPESLNYLFNPLHPDANGITVERLQRVEYDKRLFQAVAAKIQ